MPVFHVLDTEILGMGLGAEVTYNTIVARLDSESLLP